MEAREYSVDLADCVDEAEMHGRLADALPVPEDYGRNYDALHDFLCEYGVDMRLVVRNARFRTLRRVCRDAMEETPGLEVVFPRSRSRRG